MEREVDRANDSDEAVEHSVVRDVDEVRRQWDERYRSLGSADELIWHREEAPGSLVELTGAGAVEGPALDVATGLGVAAAHLVGLGIPVVGLDIAEPALPRARERVERSGGGPASWVVAAAPDLPFAPASFGFVFQRGCMHALAPDRWVEHLEEVARVLRGGGRALLLERATVLGRFAQQCPRALEVERVRTFDEHLRDGRVHPFVDVVVRRR